MIYSAQPAPLTATQKSPRARDRLSGAPSKEMKYSPTRASMTPVIAVQLGTRRRSRAENIGTYTRLVPVKNPALLAVVN